MTMRVKGWSSFIALAVVLMLSAPTKAATVWNETLDGDLSSNPLAPTFVVVAPGSNDVLGSAGAALVPGDPTFDPTTGAPNFDMDFLTFKVPTGYILKSLVPVNIVFAEATDTKTFIGLEGGTQITAGINFPYSTGALGLLGWLHVATGDVGTDILPAMGVSADGATGFSPPLPAGDYALWIQDDLPVSYDLRIEIASVPEISTWAMLLTGFAGFAFAGYRTSRSKPPRYRLELRHRVS
jgi:hypothetical protein